MPDAAAATPPPATTTAGDHLPWARPVVDRYLDARARGFAHADAMREAGALLWALRPALPPRRAHEIAAQIVARLAVP
jgi:hypothetical protein